METNPYQSPEATTSEFASRTVFEETADANLVSRGLVWGLRFVAAGLIVLCAWAVLRGGFLLLGQLFTVAAAVEFILWSYRIHTFACCLQLVGYLLSIYVPERARAAKLALLAAGLQLILLAPIHVDFVSGYLEWLLDINLLPIAVFWYFMWVVAARYQSTSIRRRLLRVATVFGVACGATLAGAFAATAGTAVAQYISVVNFIAAILLLSIAGAYGYFAHQLFRQCGTLAK